MLKIVALSIPVVKTEDDVFVWFQVRKEDGPLDGYLEFPGGKVEAGESAEAAALRELLEETHFKTQELPKLFKIYRHDYLDRQVVLYACLQDLTGTSNNFEQSGELFSLTKGDVVDLKKRMLEGNYQLIDDLILFFK
jgi:8-oxo-dGTP diphosphatase